MSGKFLQTQDAILTPSLLLLCGYHEVAREIRLTSLDIYPFYNGPVLFSFDGIIIPFFV